MKALGMVFGVAFAVASSLAASTTNAAGVITDPSGQFSVGIGANGELYDSISDIGFRRNSDGYDPLQPGVPRDSWGLHVSGGVAFADQSDFGTQNITGQSFSFSAHSASSLTTTNLGYSVLQQYSFVRPNVLDITITVKNGIYSPASVFFGRNVDWDISPTTFSENTFGPFTAPFGAGGVIDSTYDGFKYPDPLYPNSHSCLNGCNFIGDFGSGISVELNSGNFALLGQDTFHYYYGISDVGQDVNSLIGEGFSVGSGYIIATQSSENGRWRNIGQNSAFMGVYLPEPSTWTMMLVGFAGLGLALRSRRNVTA
jgi:hypothetical protein